MIAWGLASRPASIDPLFAATPDEQLVTRQIHEPLVAELEGPFDSGRTVRGLALSATPSSDLTVWRLRLRPGVRFADGTPFNSQAVLRNAERWQGSPAATPLLGDFLADAPRPDLVRFILPRPDATFDERLAAPQLGLVSPRALERALVGEIAPGELGRSGTGPFALRDRDADTIMLARETGWWGAERGLGPGVDQLDFEVIEQAGERRRALAAGAIQVAGNLGGARLRAVERDPLLTVVDLPGSGDLGIERSVRGIPDDEPAPPLNSAWRTGIDAG